MNNIKGAGSLVCSIIRADLYNFVLRVYLNDKYFGKPQQIVLAARQKMCILVTTVTKETPQNVMLNIECRLLSVFLLK